MSRKGRRSKRKGKQHMTWDSIGWRMHNSAPIADILSLRQLARERYGLGPNVRAWQMIQEADVAMNWRNDGWLLIEGVEGLEYREDLNPPVLRYQGQLVTPEVLQELRPYIDIRALANKGLKRILDEWVARLVVERTTRED